MRTKHMKKTIAVLLSAALAAGLCISGTAAENETEGTAGQTTVTEITDSTPDGAPDNAPDGVPGDFPGEPPEGAPGGTPPEKPDGNGAPEGTPPDGNGAPEGTPPDGNGDPGGMPGGAPGGSSADIDYTGAVEISSNDTQDGQAYTALPLMRMPC